MIILKWGIRNFVADWGIVMSKDYLPAVSVFSKGPSARGYPLFLCGLLGLMAGRQKGMELNTLGLIFGIDPLVVLIKLPMVECVDET